MASPLAAEVYKWTDENGIVHYSDQKPDDQEYTELEFSVSTYESVSYGTVSTPEKATRPAKSARKKRVVMFSASWCGVCKKARKYFRKKKIRFTEYDIEKSTRGKRLYRDLDATGVPVILVGKQRMNGFTESGFERIYR
ncbi:MAG: glutaredoxin family protein [Xanthomonadales bacterium]|nr:glutaredoxin family protein [Xanthomonadales bacterium]